MNTINQQTTEAFKITSSALDKVLSLRVVAFLIDYTFVAVITLAAYFIVTFLGFLTFGLGWLLFPVIFPIVALGYVGFTMGGEKQATPGMDIVGLKMRYVEGGTIEPVIAIIHTILFWFFMGLPLLLIIGLFTAKKQLLHDLLLSTVMVRKDF